MPPPPYLLSALAHLQDPAPADRPHVTLTYAQSLDAKIAGENGRQLILSGKESMVMTHWMRTLHDGIVIGVGTAANDDPQLNTRHLPAPTDGISHPLPRPIILDPGLRLSPTCKLLKNYKAGTGRQPWVLCATPAGNDRARWQQRYDTLSQAGASIIHLESSERILPVSAVLQKLSSLGIKSLMVEGGAKIINSFIQANLGTPLIDALIVTVAPILVGAHGLSYASALPSGVPRLQHFDTQVVGRDSVMILKSMTYVAM
ncbi:2,5-diamino-6-ribosylamino-4(3H)-pyrimidinone 5'-phosphate reductase [Leucoagaricus sp. SymC.cos]|nr:2,5-diamino-6-ribosylamino-4(3H)-pyrimidinone 5'-phosphate reductase [Leucoagaricus sp. SymC.cos]